MLQHVLGLLAHPKQQWQNIRLKTLDSAPETYIVYLLLLAAVPPLSLLIGVTSYGWQNLDGSLIYLTPVIAVPLALALYLLLLSNIMGVAFIMSRLEKWVGGQADFDRSLVFAFITASPLLISGIAGLVPIVWLDVLVVCVAGVFSTRLLFSGMPIFLSEVANRHPLLASIILFGALILLALSAALILSLWSLA